VISTASAPPACAQVVGRPGPRTQQLRDTLDRQARRTDTISSAPTVLDRPINRKEYDLGPGDVLDVTFFGELNEQLNVTVGPEGTAVIPKVGIARVLGANIEEAEQQIRAMVSEQYRRVDVRVNLARVRTFKVYVIGNVQDPGVRVATAATRVSEVTPPTLGSIYYRNVLLRRENGDTIHVDLVRFLQTGDLSVNPTLRGGDVVVVPLFDRTVNVYGRVAFPGMYEFRPNETLADLLRVVNGGADFPANAADTIQLTRFTSAGSREFRKLSRSDAVGAVGRSLILEPFDGVYVSSMSNYKEQRVATINGQVRRPGTYPIRHDTTTVRELVEMAGGLTPEAALTAASLRRRIWIVTRPQDETDTRDSTFSKTERYTRGTTMEIEDTAFVSIEFDKLFAEGKDVSTEKLRDGDKLNVPWRENQVVVFGAVLKPGIVPYEPGRPLDYYIRSAGGYSKRADKKDVSLIRVGTGTRVVSSDVQRVDPGDQIIVPFGVRSSFTQRLQVLGTVVGIIGNTVLTIYTIRSIIKS
jgi:protein involved in polysaccharide export with SLBB domain